MWRNFSPPKLIAKSQTLNPKLIENSNALRLGFDIDILLTVGNRLCAWYMIKIIHFWMKMHFNGNFSIIYLVKMQFNGKNGILMNNGTF